MDVNGQESPPHWLIALKLVRATLWGPSMASLCMGSVWLTSLSFQRPLDFPQKKKKKKSEPITSVRGDVTGSAWRPDWWERGGPGGRGQAPHFYSRVCPARKGHQAGLRRSHRILNSSTPLHGPLGGAWPHPPLSDDESCAGVAVRRRKTAPSKRGDGDRGRGGAAQRHDHGERIQKPAQQPPVQRRVFNFQEDHLSECLCPLRVQPGAAEARGWALLSKDSLRGEEALHGELAGSFQLFQRRKPAVLWQRSEHLVSDGLLPHAAP